MAKRDEAALKLLRWELAGHGGLVLEAMLRHPDKNLADAVELIEREIPSLSTREPQKDPPPELPMPAAPRGRSSSELDALGQEFQTFRHLLRPREAKEVEGELKELARTRDRDAMVALRRRLRALSLEAAFWSELASGAKESNAIALVILRKGKEVLAKAGETAYVDDPAVAEMIQRESEKRSKATFVMHLPVGRLVVMTGEDASIAALFRRAPGKDVVSVLTKTVEAIEENKAAARVLPVARAVQGREAVDRDQVEAVHPDPLVDVLPEDVEPVLRQLLVLVLEADLADVEDVQLHRVQAGHAELRHRGSEVLLALLEGDVQGLRPCLHVLVEHGEGEGGLHRARRAGDEDDGSPRDAAAEGLVEAFHVRLDSVHGVPANEPGRAIKGCRGDYHD